MSTVEQWGIRYPCRGNRVLGRQAAEAGRSVTNENRFEFALCLWCGGERVAFIIAVHHAAIPSSVTIAVCTSCLLAATYMIVASSFPCGSRNNGPDDAGDKSPDSGCQRLREHYRINSCLSIGKM